MGRPYVIQQTFLIGGGNIMDSLGVHTAYSFDVYSTLVVATLVLLAGSIVTRQVGVLARYSIPAPVTGGLIAAIIVLLLYNFASIELRFDTSLQEPMMLSFFATVGLGANFASMRRGGKPLVILTIGVIIMLFFQDAIGVAIAKLLGVNSLYGLVAGSVTMSGGHGTGAAWSGIFSSQYALDGAVPLAMACATYGLVMGGLIGGPVARYLISSAKIKTPGVSNDEEETITFEKPEKLRQINAAAILEVISCIAISMLVGKWASAYMLAHWNLNLPSFVCVLFVGVIISNVMSMTGFYQIYDRALSLLGNVALSLFLAIALMSMHLWDIFDLAIPTLIILLGQTIFIIIYAVYVVFPLLGRNYDAAVCSAGFCGFALGATPTAVANMQAVTGRFGISHTAFLIVPLVGAFFIDIANALVIKLFLWSPFTPDVVQAVVS